LKKIKLLEFWPKINNDNIIKLTDEQREKIKIINIMRHKKYFWQGAYHSKTDLSEKYGMSKETFLARENKGWDLERILTTPTQRRINGGFAAYVGQRYGALVITGIHKGGKQLNRAVFNVDCDCGRSFTRTYWATTRNKYCTCKPSKKVDPQKGLRRQIASEKANLVGKTVKGFRFTSRKKRHTSPGKYEWLFYGHCVECGKGIKISKYDLKNRHPGCRHK